LIYIGIDPGKNGSIAQLDEYGEYMKVEKVPTIKLKKTEYDIPEMKNRLLEINEERSFCVIEKAQGMPKQGITSTFSIGKGYGLWLGLLCAVGIPYVEIHPIVWSKALLKGAGGEGKERNYQKARQLFPQWQPKLKKEREYADSLLLAEYGRRIHGNL